VGFKSRYRSGSGFFFALTGRNEIKKARLKPDLFKFFCALVLCLFLTSRLIDTAFRELR
jgi:hypothetical protein